MSWPAGYLWSRTRYWPLRPLKRAIERVHVKLDEHTAHFRRVVRQLDTLHERVRRVRDHVEAHTEQHRAHAEKLDRLLDDVKDIGAELRAMRADFEQILGNKPSLTERETDHAT